MSSWTGDVEYGRYSWASSRGELSSWVVVVVVVARLSRQTTKCKTKEYA